MSAVLASRVLDLNVAYNVRHLGGYPTRNGRRTTCSDIIRAAGLSKLEPSAVDALYAHGVRTVVDLRSTNERHEAPDPDFATYGIASVRAPVFESDASPTGLERDAFAGFAVAYGQMLDSGRSAYRLLFKTLANTDGGVVFHCTAGKDRTGVAAALLLDFAGADDETIVEDYALTAELLQPMLKQWLPLMEERGFTRDAALAYMTADGADIQAFLDQLRARFGSAAGYLREIGLSERSLSALRARVAG